MSKKSDDIEETPHSVSFYGSDFEIDHTSLLASFSHLDQLAYFLVACQSLSQILIWSAICFMYQPQMEKLLTSMMLIKCREIFNDSYCFAFNSVGLGSTSTQGHKLINFSLLSVFFIYCTVLLWCSFSGKWELFLVKKWRNLTAVT